MRRFLPRCVVVVGLVAMGAPARADDTFTHVQTDRTSYRLGETVWYRVHRRSPRATEVVLFGPGGLEVDRKEFAEAPRDPSPSSSRRRKNDDSSSTACTGSFLIPLEVPGGSWRLAAYVEGALRHWVDLEVHDLELPKLLLELTVLARVHFPGRPVLAALRARDRDGKPVCGARVEYRAELGGLVLRDSAGVTDDDGRAMVRFELPADVSVAGHLAVGLALPGRECAVARPILVSSSVGRVEAYAEGGSVVEGFANRIALRLTDSRGRPTAAGGRIVDQDGTLATTFETGPQGLGTVLIPYDVGKSYRAVIDDPAGVSETFPMPSPSPGAVSLYVEIVKEEGRESYLRVEARAGPLAPKGAARISLRRAGRVLEEGTLTLLSRRQDGPRLAQRTLRLPREAGLYEVALERPGLPPVLRPIFIHGAAPVQVRIRPLSTGPLLPGRPVELEVFTTVGDAPASVDLALSVHQGQEIEGQDLLLRSELAGCLERTGGALPGALAAPETLDAFLIACAAPRPAGEASRPEAEPPLLIAPGVPLARRAGEPVSKPPRASDRSSARASNRASDREGSKTVVRSTALEEKLARAAFTRSALPEEEDFTFRPRVDPEMLLAPPGLGKLERAPPQDVDLPARVFDGRRTLLWASRVQTGGDGKAIVRMRLNHVVSDLTWTAQGFVDGAAVSSEGRLVPTAEFETNVDVPQAVLIGDVLDLLVSLTSRGDGGPITVSVDHSSALKPLLRTQWTYDPRKDDRRARLLFEVVEPADAAELRFTAARGLYEEVRRFRLKATHPLTEVAQRTCGYDHGASKLDFTVPANAVLGTVRLEAFVRPSWLSASEAEVEALMAEPTGCFEQTSSKNYVNLLALRTLLELGSDPLALERGWKFAREGFQKIRGFIDGQSGGFCPMAGMKPEARATVTGLRQLALHALLFQGEGQRELEAAIHWLEGQKLSASELLLVTHSLHDAGRTWKKSVEAATLKARMIYDAALQAAALACWPADAPTAPRHAERLARLLDELEPVIEKEGDDATWGTGIMGSSGGMLSLEVLGLAAGALHDGGRPEAASRAVEALARGFEIPRATQGKLLALRTLARIAGPLHRSRLDVELTANPGGTLRAARVFQGGPPILFDLASQLRPGEKGSLSLDVKSEAPVLYRMGYRYQVESPQSAPDAAFEISCTSPRAADLGAEVDVRLLITPRRRISSSQVVARVGLPAGLTVTPEALSDLMGEDRVSLAEVKDGYLDLYWARPMEHGCSLQIKTKATVAGRFAARPSMVYPYYEAGREAYAEPLGIKVHNTFGIETPMPRPTRFPTPRVPSPRPRPR